MPSGSTLRALDQTYLDRILACHLDPSEGSPYWLQCARAAELRCPPARLSFEDFKARLAFRSRDGQAQYEEDLRTRPVEDFIPRRTLRSAQWLWAAETGGTTGIAKRGTWSAEYWNDILAFSDEILDLHGVPRERNWLFIGPTGPHTTGRLLISMAERRGGRIFCIDMDPRIVRVYLHEGDTDAVERYVRHIFEQVEPILRYQNVGVMFCTASLLELMPKHLDLSLLSGLEAVVHAGLAMPVDTHRYLQEEILPGRPIVGIYGTSVSGISFQKPHEDADMHRVIYIPSQPYVVLDVIDERGDAVAYGAEGDVRCFRFTEDQLIPGFIERDRATRIAPFGVVSERYPWDWIGDPHSPASVSGQTIEGVY